MNDPQDFVFDNGKLTIVMRPKDQALKLRTMSRLTEGMPHQTAKPIFDQSLNDQPHQFVGYLSKSGKILDKFGEEKDSVQPADSLCGLPDDWEPPAFMTTGKCHEENWDGDTVLVLPRPDLRADSNTGIITKSPDPTRLGAIALRGGAKDVDCHLPVLNKIVTGDPNRDYREVTCSNK
jgi:hypothetical protein